MGAVANLGRLADRCPRVPRRLRQPIRRPARRVGRHQRATPATASPADKAFRLSSVWAAVSILAETIGTLPLKVYRDLEGAEPRSRRAASLLGHAPRQAQQHDHGPQLLVDRGGAPVLWGNASIEKARDPETGLVEELYHLHPSCVEVETDGERKRYWYNQPGGFERRLIPEQNVCHIMGLSLNGVKGESVIKCVNLFGVAMAREEFEGRFYQRGTMVRGVVEHPGRISRKPEDLANMGRLAQSLRRQHLRRRAGARRRRHLQDPLDALGGHAVRRKPAALQDRHRRGSSACRRPTWAEQPATAHLHHEGSQHQPNGAAGGDAVGQHHPAHPLRRPRIFPQSGDAIGALFCEFVLES